MAIVKFVPHLPLMAQVAETHMYGIQKIQKIPPKLLLTYQTSYIQQ